MNDLCHVCDRPTATDEEWIGHGTCYGCERCRGACFGDVDCETRRVDWRARALAGEARTERLGALCWALLWEREALIAATDDENASGDSAVGVSRALAALVAAAAKEGA